MTMPQLHPHTSLQCLTMLPPPYNHPISQASAHSHPRSTMTATTRSYTCQTTSTCTNTRITTNHHNYQAEAPKNDENLDPAPEYAPNTEPNLQKIPTTLELSDHQLHSPNHPEPAPETTSSSTVTPSTAAVSPIIRHDLPTPKNQAIWDTYHTIQKQIADIQAMLQSAIDLLQCDNPPQTLSAATTQPLPPPDRPHPQYSDLHVLADNPKASQQITTILLFDISAIYHNLHRDPINPLTTAQHWNNYKRYSSPPAPFDFL